MSTSKPHIRTGLVLLLMISVVFLAPLDRAAARDNDRAAIEALLALQSQAWNAGDIEAFMEGYWKSEDLRFASGGEVETGWEATLARYRRAYPDRAAMGRLSFDLYEIDVITDADALVFGRFTLVRHSDRPTGLFTLRLRKFDDHWRIVSDHTSSAAPAE